MTDPTPQPDLEQRALDKVNAGESWFKTNRAWLGITAAAAVIGFILGKLV